MMQMLTSVLELYTAHEGQSAGRWLCQVAFPAVLSTFATCQHCKSCAPSAPALYNLQLVKFRSYPSARGAPLGLQYS